MTMIGDIRLCLAAVIKRENPLPLTLLPADKSPGTSSTALSVRSVR